MPHPTSTDCNDPILAERERPLRTCSCVAGRAAGFEDDGASLRPPMASRQKALNRSFAPLEAGYAVETWRVLDTK
jgi:hypothetical protein